MGKPQPETAQPKTVRPETVQPRTVQPRTAEPRPRRPPGVIAISIVLLLNSAAACLVAATAIARSPVPWATVPVIGETANVVAPGPLPAPVVAAAGIAVGTATLVVTIGFFLLTPWGWTGLMLLCAVSLTINLVAVVLGEPSEASMAVAIAAVLYANQRRIQLLFRGKQVLPFEATRAADVRTPG